MNSKWLYNEMVPKGTDYTDLNTVKAYDEKMKKIRDVKAESTEIISRLGFSGQETVIEFGTATGEFAMQASKYCKACIAVDVSPAMIAYARLKADQANLTNIRFYNAGFLTYQHQGPPVDVVVSQLTLHHLPDFWKEVALIRVSSLLKPGGVFYLKDTVYSFNPGEYQRFFDNWIQSTRALDRRIAEEVEIHIREEYSTTGPVMESILQRTGFIIDKAQYEKGFLATYICKKQ